MSAAMKDYWRNYIGGKWVDGSDGGRILLLNPATGRPLSEVARATAADVDSAVAAARRCVASRALVDMRPMARGRMVAEIGRKLRERSEEIATLISLDAGKRISEARGEVEGSAKYFEYYGGLAAQIEGRYIPLGDGYVDYVVPCPYGVSAHIIPWNFPLNMIARSLSAALAAGNACVVKLPELDPTAGYVLAELAEEVGLPEGAVNLICGYGHEAGAALASHSGIDQIVFTGSVVTGRKVAHAAAENLIPAVLELGGKTPGIVYADADMDNVVAQTQAGIFFNTGQCCDTMSRLVVHESVYDVTVERLAAMASGLTIGAGIEDPDITPLISAEQLAKVDNYAQIGVHQGARAVAGGGKLDREGNFMAPTILADVSPDDRVNKEEIFGPVLSVLKFSDPREALEIANGTEYGLAAVVFTNDLDRAIWTTERLDAGQVHVNEWGVGGVETPFGGFKKSGIGREKGVEALASYYQSKNVGMKRLQSF
ncbi:aldehyde dehydrogenase family protein [Defluviimonas sp. WL0024]|uniref:Aldehyde dehydrogenase family protein n=1 Tax=Albidovulum salinarum TaxID=2984153 RepID=A0ABT2X801_9RHOB|nr:aldehyde dehydrogenase family protein [Defluviimonas sp. WL0024]MCU9850082.1 aldehyde dehydrogenase family protein [Defluviimonas sp. WL0024]